MEIIIHGNTVFILKRAQMALHESSEVRRSSRNSYSTSHEICTRCLWSVLLLLYSLQWRHNDHRGVSNHLNSTVCSTVFFKLTSKKTSNPALLYFTEESTANQWIPLAHKGPATRKTFPWDDVIMYDLTSSPCDIFTHTPPVWFTGSEIIVSMA